MAISQKQREQVAERAEFRCEYCHLRQEHSIKSHHCDHIIPRKHGGTDDDANLAWACFLCNSAKSSEVAAYDTPTGQLTPVFNPRIDEWSTHFSHEGGMIVPKTAVGRISILVLQLNRADRIVVRQFLFEHGLYP